MNKLKRIYIKRMTIYVLYNITMLILATIFNRFVQMLLFIIFYNQIQNCFTYRFHADTLFPSNPIKAVKWCKIITFVVEIVYLIFCKDLNVSIYSNLVVIFVIALINALLQFYFENKVPLDIHNEQFIRTKGKQVGLSETNINRLILRYIHNKSIKEIAKIEGIEPELIKQSLRRSKQKLGVQ